ncbi:hypothetical protein Cni_G00856 [Canna indica]|uniref:VQ domain-containing protein n=1 Tax=Canna indica TaxID=4628 RepID=A0AAQ3JNV0_9LILI|nr:hypothetical protein Cni_G00856 [Canna indica]
MASLFYSASTGSRGSPGAGEFNCNGADSLSAIFQSSDLPIVPPQLPPQPPSSIYNHRPFFDPIPYLDSTTPSWPRRASVKSSDFRAPTNIAAAAVNSLDPASTPRSTKKRTRSSRRAPTRVLTTNTSNFRAMVQQFTGVPSSPFHKAGSTAAATFSSLFGRSQLDIFRSSTILQPPPFLRRPFPDKLVQVSSSTTNPTLSSSSSSSS